MGLGLGSERVRDMQGEEAQIERVGREGADLMGGDMRWMGADQSARSYHRTRSLGRLSPNSL